MSPTSPPQVTPAPASVRLARAQAAIRALTTRGSLSPEERLELAHLQREWLAAWGEGRFVITA